MAHFLIWYLEAISVAASHRSPQQQAGTDCPCPGYCSGKTPALPAGEGPPPGVITVSQTPGVANCTTIQGAIDLTRFAYRDRYTIRVAPGTYNEKVVISANR